MSWKCSVGYLRVSVEETYPICLVDPDVELSLVDPPDLEFSPCPGSTVSCRNGDPLMRAEQLKVSAQYARC